MLNWETRCFKSSYSSATWTVSYCWGGLSHNILQTAQFQNISSSRMEVDIFTNICENSQLKYIAKIWPTSLLSCIKLVNKLLFLSIKTLRKCFGLAVQLLLKTDIIIQITYLQSDCTNFSKASEKPRLSGTKQKQVSFLVTHDNKLQDRRLLFTARLWWQGRELM